MKMSTNSTTFRQFLLIPNIHVVHKIQNSFKLRSTKNSPNVVVFGLILIEKASPIHWQYSHEGLTKNIQT